VNGKRETQPRGNCRETSAGRSAEVEGQDLRRSCPIDRCLGSYLSPLASRVRRVDPDPWTKSRLCRKTTRYLVEGEVSDVRGRVRYADPDLVESHAEIREWLGEDFDPNAFDADPLKANVASPNAARGKLPQRSRDPPGTRPAPDGYSESETDCLAELQLWVESTRS
jgi:hypothetical protein